MKYKRVTAMRLGGPEVLQVTEHELAEPGKGEVRIRVLAASVCRPDVTVRAGTAMNSGTPLGFKPPFVPGYSVIGVVDAVGEGVEHAEPGQRVGALTVTGGSRKARSSRSSPAGSRSSKPQRPTNCWNRGRLSAMSSSWRPN